MAAVQRREAELKALLETGVRVLRLSRWHYQIGPLHLFIAAGRWMNEATSRRGRINGTPLPRLIAREANGSPKI